ncbi:MAG TPA: ABC transporter permease [Terriglobia bacterium]|nr:ABC transporter permease [Terriglobia bacterium]
MSLLSSSRTVLDFLLRRKRVEREMEEELRSHLQIRADDLERCGLSRAEAERQARVEFGGYQRYKEECREALGTRFLGELYADVRYGLRQLRRSPGFTSVAIITLALGIGATMAIFSVVNGVLLRPLPYPQSDRLVSVQQVGPGTGNPASYPNFFDWRTQNHVFSSMASYHDRQFTLTGGAESLHIQAETVSAGLFGLLKVKPFVGRDFERQDDQLGANVVILSHAFWRERFHSDRSVVGRTVVLNNKGFTVIGVMPAGFQFPPAGHTDLWTSMAVDRESGSNIMTGRSYDTLSVIARLRPSVSLVRAKVDMDLIARRLADKYPQSNARQTTVRIVPELDRIVGSVRLPMLIILGVVLGVLLIACANVANLALARNVTRGREIALRSALGAHRARLCRQLLSESLLLALLGGAAGTIVAAWGAQVLVHIAPEDLPRVQRIGMDWRVLAFALALSLLTGVLFGTLPALLSSKTSLTGALKEAGPASSDGVSHGRLRGGLVMVEIALALVLLAGAGLLIASYLRLSQVDPGFEPHNLLSLKLDLPSPPYNDAAQANFINQLVPRLQKLPGVRSVAADWTLPFSGEIDSAGVDFEGRTFAPGYTPSIRVDGITPGYFRTMGIPLLQGRTFTNRDTASSLPVVIVNEALARKYYPNESVIGKQIRPSISATSATPWREIVGVVGNTKLGGLAENFQPEYYLPFAQFPIFSTIVLRTQVEPLRLVPAVRTVITSMDENVPVYDVSTMGNYLASSVARSRFSTLLLGLFGGLALVLAAIGIYGVVSYSVSQRTHELGIRMALGAQKTDVLRMVIINGIKMALVGVGIGIVGALGLARFLSSLLYGVKSTDPLTFVIVSVLLTSVALLACYIPARRAAKVDPMVALRHE